MAKKRKVKRRKSTHRVMMVRVAVPVRQTKDMKIKAVIGQCKPGGIMYDLQVLTANYA